MSLTWWALFRFREKVFKTSTHIFFVLRTMSQIVKLSIQFIDRQRRSNVDMTPYQHWNDVVCFYGKRRILKIVNMLNPFLTKVTFLTAWKVSLFGVFHSDWIQPAKIRTQTLFFFFSIKVFFHGQWQLTG